MFHDEKKKKKDLKMFHTEKNEEIKKEMIFGEIRTIF